MGSNLDDSVSHIYLTVPSELIYGEGEEMPTTPCYDEVFQNSLQWNDNSVSFSRSGNNDNSDTNSSSNYYNNVNIYESLRKKKECYLRDLINNVAFSTPCQQTTPSKKQKVKQLLTMEISKNKGKVCFVILLSCLAVNIGALVYKFAQNTAINNGLENKVSDGNYSVYYFEKPWYQMATGKYSGGCIEKNYKTLSHVYIVKIKRMCDKVPVCLKEIQQMATLQNTKFNFIIDREGNVYEGLNWQCTMVSDTLVIGYFDNNNDQYCIDCLKLMNYFIHMPNIIRYGKMKGLLNPILYVTSDCYSDLMDVFFKTMD